MISFEDSLPASYEVTFLPLAITYVWFGLGMMQSVYVAVVGPMVYILMCLFFLLADVIGGITLKLFAAKVFFVAVSLSPAALIVAFR